MASGLAKYFPVSVSSSVGNASFVTPHGFMPYLYSADGITTVLRIARGLVRGNGHTIPTENTGDDFGFPLGEAKDFFVAVTYDGDGNPTEAEVIAVAVDTIPSDVAGTAHQFLFRVDALGVVTVKDVWSSLGFRLCGGTADFWGLRGGA